MAESLKKLIQKNPELLDRKSKKELRGVRHFQFTVIDPEDQITIPVCGDCSGVSVKHNIHAVDCPECLAALDFYAHVDKHEDALAYARKLVPKVMRPDPEIMEKKHGTEQSIEAKLHTKALAFLRSKGVTDPDDLHKKTIGVTERTFLINMIETGLITKDIEPTGLTAAEAAAGKLPPAAEQIFIDE